MRVGGRKRGTAKSIDLRGKYSKAHRGAPQKIPIIVPKSAHEEVNGLSKRLIQESMPLKAFQKKLVHDTVVDIASVKNRAQLEQAIQRFNKIKITPKAARVLQPFFEKLVERFPPSKR